MESPKNMEGKSAENSKGEMTTMMMMFKNADFSTSDIPTTKNSKRCYTRISTKGSLEGPMRSLIKNYCPVG